MAPRPQLIVFAKWPAPGQVKTRLCPPLHAAQASDLYRAFLLDLLPRVLGDWDAVVACHPPTAVTRFEQLVPPEFTVVPQVGESLGERMANAFAAALASGPAAVLIGSDIPHLPRPTLEKAFAALAERACDVTFAADEGGGYWLVGERPPAQARLFLDLPMSVADNYALTLRRSAELGLRVHELDSCFDIDTGEDLARLVRLLRDEDTVLARELPNTIRSLEELGWL